MLEDSPNKNGLFGNGKNLPPKKIMRKATNEQSVMAFKSASVLWSQGDREFDIRDPCGYKLIFKRK